MFREYTCDYCGEYLEYIESEWAKYMMCDSEEIVEIWACKKCKKQWCKREGNFALDSETEFYGDALMKDSSSSV